MPQIPRYQRSQLPSGQGTYPSPIITTQLQQKMGQLGQHMTQIGADWIDKIQKARAEMEYQTAYMEYMKSMNDFRLELERDPDWENYDKKYEEFRQKTFQNVRQNMNSNTGILAFEQAYEQDAEKRRVEIMSLQRQKEVQSMLADLEKNINLAVQYGDKNLALKHIAGAIEANIIDEDKAEKLRQQVAHDILFNEIDDKLKQMTPEDAEAWVSDSSNTPGLTHDDRNQLISDAWGRYSRNEARRRDQQNENYDQGIQMYMDGNLTFSWVKDDNTDLTASQREHLYNLLMSDIERAKAGMLETPDSIYGELFAMLKGKEGYRNEDGSVMSWQQVEQWAYENPNIAKKDLFKINDLIKKYSENPSVQIAYDSLIDIHDALKRQIDISTPEGLQQLADLDQQFQLWHAQVEQWLENNPNVTDEKIRQATYNIVNPPSQDEFQKWLNERSTDFNKFKENIPLLNLLPDVELGQSLESQLLQALEEGRTLGLPELDAMAKQLALQNQSDSLDEQRTAQLKDLFSKMKASPIQMLTMLNEAKSIQINGQWVYAYGGKKYVQHGGKWYVNKPDNTDWMVLNE